MNELTGRQALVTGASRGRELRRPAPSADSGGVSVIDDMLAASRDHTHRFDVPLPTAPARKVVVVTCMDSRIDLFDLLGLSVGDAHVLRNAGGVVTDDVIRSLCVSQRLLGTESIMLIHHTRCGMLAFRDDDLKDEIEAETGLRPAFAFDSFSDPEGNVGQSIARLHASPFVVKAGEIRGFVYDVDTGELTEVTGLPAEAKATLRAIANPA